MCHKLFVTSCTYDAIQCQKGELIRAIAFRFNNVRSHFYFPLVQTEILLKRSWPSEHLCEGDVGKADRLNLGFLCANKACLTRKVSKKIVSLWQAGMQSINNSAEH